MSRYSHKFFAQAFSCGLALGGCTGLPALEEATGGVPVAEVVQRVKCEVSAAFQDGDGRWLTEEQRFAWLQTWTAQIDLTMQILDTATLSPGVTVMQPLHNGFSAAAGPSSQSVAGVPGTTLSAISQSVAVAGGASVSGQAQRTETISFALSLEELKAWRKSSDTSKLCQISDQMDLRGRLGLKEWVADALSPVTERLLWAGYHPKPGAAAAPTGSKGSPAGTPPTVPKPAIEKKELIDKTSCNLVVLKQRLAAAKVEDAIYDAASTAKTNSQKDNATAAQAKTTAEKTLTALKKKFSDYSKGFDAVLDPSIKYPKIAGGWLGKSEELVAMLASAVNLAAEANAKAVTAANAVATTKAAFAQASKAIDDAQKAGPADQDRLSKIACDDVADAEKLSPETAQLSTNATHYAGAVKTNAAAAAADLKMFTEYASDASDYVAGLPPIDPPIQTIGQSVQFMLIYGGNVTPTWTFVRFKGPNAPLFSADKTRMHLLTITLGAAASGTAKGATQSIATNQQNLLFYNLLTNHPSR